MTPPRRCTACLRPEAACLCRRAVPVANATPVLILQHPDEAMHAKGSARLLHLSLQASRLEVGTRFDEAALAAWCGEGAALLYPADDRAPVRASLDRPARLVVLDATWRKSRRLLADHPLLARLPRWPLQPPLPPSRYASRRAHRPEQRSTLEATLLALAALDGPQPAHDALLAGFDACQADWLARAAAGVADGAT